MKLSKMIEEMTRMLRKGDCEVVVHESSNERLPAECGEGADSQGNRAVLITPEPN